MVMQMMTMDYRNDEDDEPGLGFDITHIWTDQITPD